MFWAIPFPTAGGNGMVGALDYGGHGEEKCAGGTQSQKPQTSETEREA